MKTPGTLCVDCPNRSTLLQVSHDVNNACSVLITGMATDEEIVHAAGTTRQHMRVLMELTKNTLQASSLESITVAEYLDNIRKVAALHDSLNPWTSEFHMDHLKEIAHRKVLWGGHDEEVIISDNFSSNWKQADVTKIHVTIKPFGDDGFVVEVIDNGCGMDRLHLEKIQTGVPNGAHGAGCQIIKRLFSKSGKTIVWDSIPYIGTRMAVRIFFVD